MIKYSQVVILFLLTSIIIGVLGCGYKPSSKYAREVLGNKVSTSVVISQTDPENSVIIKDAVDKAVIEIFHSNLVEKRYATTHLNLRMNVPTYTAVQYDTNGFITGYRARVTLLITRESKDIKKDYTAIGTYDFPVLPNSILTEQERFDAIKFSSFKAIAAFVAQVSAEGSQAK